MVQIAGKYQFVENKNLQALLQGIGIEEARAKVITEDKGGLEIKIDGNKITLVDEGPRGTSTVIVGEEYEKTLPNGKLVKSFATLQGDVLNVTSKTLDGEFAGSRTYTVTESGLEMVVTLPRDGKTYSATRIFKRI